MIYLLDTIAVIRHFSGKGKIGKKALQIFKSFETSDNEFSVSVISLMEILYLNEKQRINIELYETINLLTETDGYNIIDLNTEIIKTASDIEFYELHDRMILATARWLDIPIISSDSRFEEVEDIEVIWD